MTPHDPAPRRLPTERQWTALRGRLGGDLFTDLLHRVAYSADASIYRIVPRAVAAPRDVEDIRAVLAFAAEYDLAVTPRGAGSGVAGESLTAGIVLDLSRHLRRIVAADDGRSVTCEAGAVLDQVNARLRPLGVKIGPDPSSANRATVGGSVANNATGAHSLQYGHLGRYVQAVETVLADGSVATFANGMTLDEGGEDTRARALAGQCLDLLGRHDEVIAAAQPQTRRNRCGYNVAGVAAGGRIDMARLLAGSEGTLGIFSQVTLATVPLPPAQGLLQLAFDSLEAMGAAVPVVVAQGASACELMDARLLAMAREALPQYRDLFPADATALLLIEQVGPDAEAVRAALERTRRAVGDAAGEARLACRPEEQQRLWKSRKDAVPLLYRQGGRRHPIPFIEDVSVPHTALEAYIRGLDAIAARHDTPFAYYGHAGDGELHVRPYLDLHRAEDVQRMRQLADEVFALAWSLGGSISGEHGDGLVRTGFIARQYGEAYYGVLREVKRTFDPARRLNPGKVINDDPDVMVRDLRRAPVLRSERLTGPLALGEEELTEELLRCNGCGLCRTEQATLRMCPVFRALGDELGTSRAKVTVLEAWATGQLDEASWRSPAFRQFLDLCVHCKACRQQCPSRVDVSKLMTAARARYAAQRGLRPVERLLSANRYLGTLGTALAPLANLALRLRPVGWLLEAVGGLDRNRRLPAYARGRFLAAGRRYLAGRPIADPVDRVVYFLDAYASDHDHALGYAVLDLLGVHGVEVVLPPQRPVPLPALCYGNTRRARRDLGFIVRHLAPYVARGYTVVCSEPSAALVLREEASHVVPGAEAEGVAAHTLDLMDYLEALRSRGLLPAPACRRPGPYAYHRPCHVMSPGPVSAGLTLLRDWAGAEVLDLDAGCCGLSGTYGMQRRHADLSQRMGRRLREALADLPSIPVLTECAACKMQIEHLGAAVVQHPVKVLAEACGLAAS